MGTRLITGCCDSTGAAIYVILGQVPVFARVRFPEDAHSNEYLYEWSPEMAEVSGCDEGWLYTNGIPAPVNANGISAYNGGDEIVFDKTTNNRWEDSAGNSVEEKYVDGHNKESETGLAFRCYGNAKNDNPYHGEKVTTGKGFVIGATDPPNTDGEKIIWEAWIDE
ncbi:MAG: hypothetical protein V2A77_02720 [Pseudomonadota bacterium]